MTSADHVSGRSTVSVDLETIVRNARAAQRLFHPARLLGVVKCDGYGHGATAVGRALVRAGCPALGVAFVEEGVALRDAVPNAEILVFTEPLPGQESVALAAGLTLTVYTADCLKRVAVAGRALGRNARVHLKIDTGMHRFGVYSGELDGIVDLLADSAVEFEGLWTHFATADHADDADLQRQLAELLQVRRKLADRGLRPRYVHAANTAAALRAPEARLDLVRVGAALYGLRPSSHLAGFDDFSPALRWTSRVISCKRVGRGERVSYGLRYRTEQETTMVVVPVGFGDGLSRLVGNRGEMVVRGRRYGIAGLIGMSHALLDVGDDPVTVGDEVTILGAAGDTGVGVEEMAQWCAATSYEVVTRISPAISRVYGGRDVPAVAAVPRPAGCASF